MQCFGRVGDRPQGVAGDCNSLAETHAWFDSRVAHHSQKSSSLDRPAAWSCSVGPTSHACIVDHISFTMRSEAGVRFFTTAHQCHLEIFRPRPFAGSVLSLSFKLLRNGPSLPRRPGTLCLRCEIIAGRIFFEHCKRYRLNFSSVRLRNLF